MADKSDTRRRALGAFFLLAALGMLVVGETVLKERLRLQPLEFLIFWMACFAFVGMAILIAALDMALVRRRVREEQRKLVEETINEIVRTKASKSGKAPQKSGNSK